MHILQYRGISLVSKAIRFQTRSVHSHSAIQLNDGSVVEAWQDGGVRHRPDPYVGHTRGTKIDVYSLRVPIDEPAVETFLIQQLGKEYDFLSVARFLSRRQATLDNKWFCSELVLEACQAGGLALLNGISSYMSPRDVGLSPYLVYEKQIGKN